MISQLIIYKIFMKLCYSEHCLLTCVTRISFVLLLHHLTCSCELRVYKMTYARKIESVSFAFSISSLIWKPCSTFLSVLFSLLDVFNSCALSSYYLYMSGLEKANSKLRVLIREKQVALVFSLISMSHFGFRKP